MIQLKRKKAMIESPMNAMSDVGFLLLIFIMLVSLINYRKEIKIDYPEAYQAAKVDNVKNLEIWIDKDGTLYIDGSSASLQDVEDTLYGIYQTEPDTRVHVIADKNTPFESVDKVIDVLQLLEYRVVSFVVKTDE